MAANPQRTPHRERQRSEKADPPRNRQSERQREREPSEADDPHACSARGRQRDFERRCTVHMHHFISPPFVDAIERKS
jgi:hypothetical protein